MGGSAFVVGMIMARRRLGSCRLLQLSRSDLLAPETACVDSQQDNGNHTRKRLEQQEHHVPKLKAAIGTGYRTLVFLATSSMASVTILTSADLIGTRCSPFHSMTLVVEASQY
jgi:hypothetical protein